MIVLDTHTLLWLRRGDRRLGSRSRSAIEGAWQAGEVAVSAISFWEVAMLRTRKRIEMAMDVQAWRRENLAQGLIELPVDGAIGIRAAGLADLPGDPADRLIVATALEGHRLVTADRQILDWPGPLSRLDATG